MFVILPQCHTEKSVFDHLAFLPVPAHLKELEPFNLVSWELIVQSMVLTILFISNVKTIWGVSFVFSGLMCLYYLFWFTFGKRRKGLLACRQKKKKVRKEGGSKEPIPSWYWFSEFEELGIERQKIKWALGMLQGPEDIVSSRGMKRILRSVTVSNKLDLCWHPWKNSSKDLDAVLFLSLYTDTGLWTDSSYILVADVILSGMETFVFNEY